jgi:mannose-6-phosphate isomerase-like protein (cupin superfamily)
MEKMALVVMMLLAVPLMAAGPAEVNVWTAADLKARGEKLAQKMNEQKANEKKMLSESLGTFGNHLTMIGRRDADGVAEIHEAQADFFFVQSGTATLVFGGEVPGAKTTAPGELRGPSIKGGERKTLGPGDVVHIPARIPHQLLVPAGKEFTYFVIKVDTP